MLVVFDARGRLGNRLQTASYALVFACERKISLVLYCLRGYEEFFSCVLDKGRQRNEDYNVVVPNSNWVKYKILDILYRIIELNQWCQNCVGIHVLRGTKERPLILTDENISSLCKRGKKVILRGYYIYADPNLLYKHKITVNQFFKPKDKEKSRSVERYVAAIKEKCDCLVGVHIRQGDYKGYAGGKHYFDCNQYAAFMKDLAQSVPGLRVSFIICSDEDVNEDSFDGLEWEHGPSDLFGDLYALSLCDYVLGPYSTFNRWSAYYGEVPRLEIKKNLARVDFGKFKLVENLSMPGLKDNIFAEY